MEARTQCLPYFRYFILKLLRCFLVTVATEQLSTMGGISTWYRKDFSLLTALETSSQFDMDSYALYIHCAY
jgi:hypothetical protein